MILLTDIYYHLILASLWHGLRVIVGFDIIGMEGNGGEIFIEEIMSSEQSGEKALHEVELGLKVESGKENEELSSVVVYRVVARKVGSNLEWEIFRKY